MSSRKKNYCGYVNVNVDVEVDVEDVLVDCSDDQLIDELEERDYEVIDYEKTPEILTQKKFFTTSYLSNEMKQMELYRYLCDYIGSNYFIDKDQLIRQIREKI